MYDKTTNVYVAGASADWERAKTRMDWVRAHPGLTLAYDWVSDVVKYRVEGGKSDAELTDEERFFLAGSDMEAVARCDIFWLLIPNDSVVTGGAWADLGFALDAGRSVVVSGARHREFSLCILADHACSTDTDAQGWILEAHHG